MQRSTPPALLCFSPQRTGQLVTCHLSRPLIFGPLCHPQSCQLFPKPVIPRGVQALSHQGTVCLAKWGQWLRPPPAPGLQQRTSNESNCWQHGTRNTLEGNTCDQKPFREVTGAESSGAPGGRQECSLLGRQWRPPCLTLALHREETSGKKTGHEATSCTLRPTPIFPEPTTRALPYSLQSPKPQRPEQARLHLHTCPASSGTRDPGPLPPAPCAFLTSLCSFFLPSQPLFSNEKAENAGWGIGSPGLSSGGKITFALISLWQNWPFHSLALNMRLGRRGRKSQKVGLCRTHCLSVCVCVCVCVL